MRPLVSVIMSVYNSEKYLNKAIESILKQTYTNLEFIIINDGSTDSSLKIIRKYLNIDNRIKLIDNIENKGLIYSLNKGIELSKGKYIARMDADDISSKHRIKEQVEFMESNRDIILCGTSSIIFLDGKEYIRKRINILSDYEKVKANSIFECSFVHPSVILRSDIIKKENFNYKEDYKHAEDFGLWAELIPKYKVFNINKPLIRYRITKRSLTREANKDLNQRKEVLKKIYDNYLRNLNVKVSKEQLDIHYNIAMIQNINKGQYKIQEKLDYLIYLDNKFKNIEVSKCCANQFLKNCVYESNYKIYKQSKYYKILPITKIKFANLKYIYKMKNLIKKMYE